MGAGWLPSDGASVTGTVAEALGGGRWDGGAHFRGSGTCEAGAASFCTRADACLPVWRAALTLNGFGHLAVAMRQGRVTPGAPIGLIIVLPSGMACVVAMRAEGGPSLDAACGGGAWRSYNDTVADCHVPGQQLWNRSAGGSFAVGDSSLLHASDVYFKRRRSSEPSHFARPGFPRRW